MGGLFLWIMTFESRITYLETDMTDTNNKKWKGVVAGTIALIISLAAMIAAQPNMFVPILLAIIVAFVGLIIAIVNKNPTGIGINLIAIVLAFWAAWTAPVTQNAYHNYLEKIQRSQGH